MKNNMNWIVKHKDGKIVNKFRWKNTAINFIFEYKKHYDEKLELERIRR